MTVEELLELARAFCDLSNQEAYRDSGVLGRAAQYAAIAKAHATTAQAMMQWEQYQEYHRQKKEQDCDCKQCRDCKVV